MHLVKNVTAALAGTCTILMGAMMGPSALLNSVRSIQLVKVVEAWLSSDWCRAIGALFLPEVG